MGKVTINRISKDFQFIKEKACSFFEEEDFEKALKVVEFACRSAYCFNFKYVDEDLEDLCRKISKKLINNISLGVDTEFERYVFYDCFAYDNRGLTQQYIRALNQWRIPFLFVLANDNISISSDIIEELNKMPEATIFILPSGLSYLEKVKVLNETILAYNPTKAFLHMSPWDSVGVTVWNAHSEIKKYQINLTDHAFWLGKGISDYLIEFRHYGCNISLDYRGFKEEQILLQPYYPIVSQIPFEGFPVDVKEKVVLFTGGAYYKMYGEKNKFFYLLKEILDSNDNTILLIAGSGNVKPLQDFIKSNNFTDRIFLLSSRRDISSVFDNIDIYIGTFPITGGLMSQFAAEKQKCIVAFTTSDIPSNFLDELIHSKDRVTFTDERSFLNEVTKLVQDVNYRNEKAKSISPIINNVDFNKNLFQLIKFGSAIPKKINRYKIDTFRFTSLYLEAENNYLKTYDNLIFTFSRFCDFKVPISMKIRSFKFAFKKVFKLV